MNLEIPDPSYHHYVNWILHHVKAGSNTTVDDCQGMIEHCAGEMTRRFAIPPLTSMLTTDIDKGIQQKAKQCDKN